MGNGILSCGIYIIGILRQGNFTVITMYITMLPVIIGGILNMIFTKTPIYNRLKKPIDNNKNFRDGRPILGSNKTWIGFFSMIGFCALAQVLWGMVCKTCGLFHELYVRNPNHFIFNLAIGSLFGFVYMLFELPNSFLKRRLGIESGKTKSGILGALFFVIDQIDSLIGVILVLYIFSDITIVQYFEYIALGGITHILVNLALYLSKIRRNL